MQELQKWAKKGLVGFGWFWLVSVSSVNERVLVDNLNMRNFLTKTSLAINSSMSSIPQIDQCNESMTDRGRYSYVLG